MGTAVAAAVTGYPSEQLFQHLGAGGARLPSHANVVPPRGRRGGLPVIKEGTVQGGCGVSGAPTAEQDEECARAGIASLNAASEKPAHATYADRTSPARTMASSA
jgi:uncharacterized protein GlcG (DUF336 family)